VASVLDVGHGTCSAECQATGRGDSKRRACRTGFRQPRSLPPTFALMPMVPDCGRREATSSTTMTVMPLGSTEGKRTGVERQVSRS
jgi:hypothetical protein